MYSFNQLKLGKNLSLNFFIGSFKKYIFLCLTFLVWIQIDFVIYVLYSNLCLIMHKIFNMTYHSCSLIICIIVRYQNILVYWFSIHLVLIMIFSSLCEIVALDPLFAFEIPLVTSWYWAIIFVGIHLNGSYSLRYSLFMYLDIVCISQVTLGFV